MKRQMLKSKPISIDVASLVIRIVFGASMLTHGYPKLEKVMAGNFKFGDPIGIGAELSLILTTFSEFFCSILIIIGLLTRLASIPLFITMAVAFFIVHSDDDFGTKEKAILYLAAYVILFFIGPGKYLLDQKFKN